LSEDIPVRAFATRLNQRDAHLLDGLRALAAPQLQRIANQCLALCGIEDAQLNGIRDAKQRLHTERAILAWLEGICSATELASAVPNAGLRWPPTVTAYALLLLQDELGRLADDYLGSRAADARRALLHALTLQTAALFGAAELSTLQPVASSTVSSEEQRRVRALAHAIRNPLNGAMLHATFLERELEDVNAGTELLEAAATIKAEIRHVAELLEDGVDTPSRAAHPRARVLVSSLCNQAIELVARDAAAAGIEVGADTAELGAVDLMLEVDVSRMLDVLSQLLQQAVEAALSGGGKVLLRARRESDSAIIEVRHDQKALTTPVPILGSLLPAASEHDADAAHFGNLNVAITVVAEHGGTIEVDSQPGRTEFRVKLPIGAALPRALESC
jgi:signal transduction histidine kinase